MYTILIVDDERPAQTFLKAICQKYCPAFDTILLSGSADDALRLMAQQHVHVLVTDISMPGINGLPSTLFWRRSPRYRTSCCTRKTT